MRDIDIRRELLREMHRRHDGESDTLIMPELGLCQGMARVDLAVVNGTIHGYEIKSEQDTLARLPSQAEVYSRTLEFVTIIASASHSQKIRDLIPSWWGIWIAIEDENGVSLKPVRDSRPNRKIDPFSLAQLLWREEAFQVLSDRGLTRGMRSKPRGELWRKLVSELTIEDLANVVRGCLKRRGAAWRVPVLQA